MTQLFDRPAPRFASALLLLACAGAAAGDALPAVQQAGAVSYRTGGVGLDESMAMKAAAPGYPLAMTFAVRIGARDAYAAAIKVHISAADGATVLDVVSDGPFLLVDLPAGKYQVKATKGDDSKSSSVEIGHGAHRSLVFVWLTGERQ